jgi:RNA polymerase sigma-70 factor, ECF subfamily
MLRSSSMEHRPRSPTPSLSIGALDDEQLIALIADRDEQAFEEIFDRHAGSAYSLACRVCGRKQAAERIVQDAFLSLWRGGVRYDRTLGSVRVWLHSIVAEMAADTVPRAPCEVRRQAPPPRDSPHIREALDNLRPEQRQVIELAHSRGLTARQIAQHLQVSPITVKENMRLGLLQLRAALRPPPTTNHAPRGLVDPATRADRHLV